jgi:hypothetical protein
MKNLSCLFAVTIFLVHPTPSRALEPFDEGLLTTTTQAPPAEEASLPVYQPKLIEADYTADDPQPSVPSNGAVKPLPFSYGPIKGFQCTLAHQAASGQIITGSPAILKAGSQSNQFEGEIAGNPKAHVKIQTGWSSLGLSTHTSLQLNDVSPGVGWSDLINWNHNTVNAIAGGDDPQKGYLLQCTPLL